MQFSFLMVDFHLNKFVRNAKDFSLSLFFLFFLLLFRANSASAEISKISTLGPFFPTKLLFLRKL